MGQHHAKGHLSLRQESQLLSAPSLGSVPVPLRGLPPSSRGVLVKRSQELSVPEGHLERDSYAARGCWRHLFFILPK